MSRVASGSIVLGLIVLSLKAAAWWLTGSAALYSDALESVVNVAAAVVAFWALRLAARPADANHPYGHAKVEFFAAVVEGGLIVAAAALIVQNAWISWREPHPIQAPGLGLGLNALATIGNGAWAVVLARVAARVRSPTLAADSRHLAADVITSIGLALGVVASVASGRSWLDPVVAAATAIYVLWAGLRLISESVGGLMDAAPAPAVVERIRSLVGEHAEGALEVHDLRTRHAGQLSFLEFHLVVPGAMTVDTAHEICDRIEEALRCEMQNLAVTIHVEPDAKAKHHGVLVL